LSFLKTGFADEWFWTGALKDANSTRWYWEPTGNDITEFFWGPLEPNLEDDLTRVCIDFRFEMNWQDDKCDAFRIGTICEYF